MYLPVGLHAKKPSETMDLRKQMGRALSACTVVVALLFALPAGAQTTVWLVRPLYPGQEALVGRTEQALDKLMPGEARKDAIIGMKELGLALKGRSIDELACFGQERCADPIDPFMAGLGFDRVVLIQGGQDEAGFKFRVVSYEPKEKKVTPASSTNANLEKALLGAVAKVVPAASSLEVKSNPAGATVYVDDVKVGVTPLNTQVLPGERTVRLDLKLHQPIEESIIIPIRGTASIEKTLEKVAARIVITAAPAGVDIFIDGQLLGKDRVDRGILPGSHTIRLTADKHKAFEQQISVKADEQYAFDKTLEPIPGQANVGEPTTTTGTGTQSTTSTTVSPNIVVRTEPKPPASDTDQTYDRRSYVHALFEYSNLTGSNLVGMRIDHTGRTQSITTGGRTLIGASFELGTFVSKYFGFALFGLTYLRNTDSWDMSVGFEPGKAQENANGMVGGSSISGTRVNLAVIRAIQPQVRFAVWRIQFSLQAGAEFRTGQILGTGPGDEFYGGGFVVLDLLLGARFNVKVHIVEGLYLTASGNYSQYLYGANATDTSGNPPTVSSSAWGFSAGIGYAY